MGLASDFFIGVGLHGNLRTSPSGIDCALSISGATLVKDFRNPDAKRRILPLRVRMSDWIDFYELIILRQSAQKSKYSNFKLNGIIMIRLLSVSFFTLTLLSSCLTYMSGQDGRTVGKNEFSAHGGVSYYRSTSDLESGRNGTDESINYFAAVRTGVTDSLDVGVKASTAGMGGLISKIQLVESGTFAMSLGLEGAYLKRSRKQSNGAETSESFVDNDVSWRWLVGEVPLFLSLDLSPELSIYATPRYVHIDTQTQSYNEPTSNGSARELALSVGILTRGAPGGFLELVYSKNTDKDSADKGQFEIGIGMNLSTKSSSSSERKPSHSTHYRG